MELMVALKGMFLHYLYGQCGPCVFQWNGGCAFVDLFGCMSFGCWCVHSICFVLGFQFLWVEATSGGVHLSTFYVLFSVPFLLSLHWLNACLPMQYMQVLVWWSNFWQLKHCSGCLTKGLIRKFPCPLEI